MKAMRTFPKITVFAFGLAFLLPSVSMASGLTNAQIQGIVSLLSVFGADAATISNVSAILHGQAVPGTASAGTACVALDRDLSVGMTDATTNGEVSGLQQFLGGNVTGYFGPVTLRLVQDWQSAHGITSSGFVGQETRAAMNCGDTAASQTQAATISSAPTDWNTYEVLPADFVKNPPAYIGDAVKVGGSVTDFLAKSDRGGASNFIEMLVTSSDALGGQKLMLEIDDDSLYALAASKLNDLSGIIAYGTVQASQQFTTSSGGISDVPVISVTRLDTCGLIMCPLAASSSYTIQTIFPAGITAAQTQQATTSVPPIQAPPTCTLSISPSSIMSDTSATLSWTTTNATSLSLDHGINFITPISSGSTSVSPSSNTTYTGTVMGPGGSANCAASINVAAPTTWHTAYTYSGSTAVNTPSFTLEGSEWRITYTCSLTDASVSSAYFSGDVDSTDNSVDEQFANTTSCPGQNTSYVYSDPPGQYYLDLNEINAGYTVKVEDLY